MDQDCYQERFPWSVTLTMRQVIWKMTERTEQTESEKTDLDRAVELAMKRHERVKVSPEPEFITPELASKNLILFRRKLNDRLFGRRWDEKGKGLKVIPFFGGLNTKMSLGNRDDLWWDNQTAEKMRAGSRLTQNIHYHCSFGPELSTHHRGQVLEQERSLDEVTDLIKDIHNRTPFGEGISQVRVEHTRDTGWLIYGEEQEFPVNGADWWDNLDQNNLILN